MACNKVNLKRTATHWSFMLRVAGSLITNQVRAYDLLRMFGREGHPLRPARAFAEYGRIDKVMHLLGLVLNAVVLWNTRYLGAAFAQLRAEGHDIKDEDVARLSPLNDRHINFLGRYAAAGEHPMPADLSVPGPDLDTSPVVDSLPMGPGAAGTAFPFLPWQGEDQVVDGVVRSGISARGATGSTSLW